MINEARYRENYPGEFVIVETQWSAGKKEQKREWVPNPIENQHISHRASCILSNHDQFRFDFARLTRHRGGLLSSKKFQNYGTGYISQHMNLDFAVEVDAREINNILSRNYQEKNIVYTTTRQCLIHPGEFYLIPYNPKMCNEALVVYLAAFDGHKEIFILGANRDIVASNSAWADQIKRVFDVYLTTQFIGVGPKLNFPQSWFDSTNFKSMDYPEFVSHCDC